MPMTPTERLAQIRVRLTSLDFCSCAGECGGNHTTLQCHDIPWLLAVAGAAQDVVHEEHCLHSILRECPLEQLRHALEAQP